MKKIPFFLIVVLIHGVLLSQVSEQQHTLNWKGVESISQFDGTMHDMLRFEGSVHNPENGFLPQFVELIELHGSANFSIELKHSIFEPLLPGEIQLIDRAGTIGTTIVVSTTGGYANKHPVGQYSFVPIRKNEITGFYEKLTQFTAVVVEESVSPTAGSYKSSNTYKSQSVLANGAFYKFATTNDGLHKITLQDLTTLGMSAGSIDPRNIRIYGLRGGMLPEDIDDFRYDDLQELAIYVEGENDGAFNDNDYILFYGQSPNQWKYLSQYHLFKKQLHYYSDYTYYFLTADLGAGKRVQNENSSTNTPTNFVSSFHDAIHYEVEETNLLNSGRIWYGETFDLYNNMVKEFNITNLDMDRPVILLAEAAARSKSTSFFSFYVNGDKKLHLSIPGVNTSNINGDYADVRRDTARFYPSGNNLSVEVIYTKSTNSSVGYLDYFTLNFTRDLAFDGGQLPFRHMSTATAEHTTSYTLSKSNQNVQVWNITNPLNPQRIETTLNGTQMQFVMESDSLQQFIAFDNSSFFAINPVGKIENQNLHGMGEYEMVILSHPNFTAEAERLAQFHRDYDDLRVLVTDPQTIYNEFSSGSQDISAIRDFLKMMYDKASAGNEIRYLLLFGDGSFDYKNRVENNSNYVPTWESYESLNPVSSYVKDDFYALLDGSGDNFVDIGVGRFVVSTAEQARSIVDKTIHYATNADAVMGDWRNIVCLIADDEDSNLHFGDAEDLAAIIDTTDHALNIDKIYLDAYQQVSTPSGERYPDVTRDINTKVDQGVLIMNYVGHGGEGGLAHERIMTINDINSWSNMDNMPVFITATCEFSRFDDPERVSAGEYISLNPNGGGIALFTTTRATYAGANFDLNRNFYRYALQRIDGKHRRMGDIILLAKNASGSVENKSKFMLIGDPALRIAFPQHNVITAAINDVSVSEPLDTIKALSTVTIRGEIQDYQGNPLTDFNGQLFPTVFDKPSKFSTLGNDPSSSPAEFYIQKNALYKGKTTIENGQWAFTFIAPKDLAYNFDYGKLSYYAKNEHQDAYGYFTDVTVGGYNEYADVDETGPEVNLYINDINFQSGGLTDENPNLFAMVFDESGINTVGNGIGHDILATLNGEETFILNNYYEAELDDYQRGSITYPFFGLDNGRHTLSLKVWDIYNNSTTVQTEFIVAESVDMAVGELFNFPNPFSGSTTFTFEHNQVEQPLDISITIYALDGRLVATLTDLYYAGGYRYNSGKWNGTDNNGNNLPEGMYVYKVLVKNYDGSVMDKTNKLVIIK